MFNQYIKNQTTNPRMSHSRSHSTNSNHIEAPTKRKSFQISQPIHQTNINEPQTSPLSLNSSPPTKKARHSHSNNRNTQQSNHINRSNEEHNSLKTTYRPTHIYSSMLPLESEEEIMSSYKRPEHRINFSCIGYNSLIEYCQTFKL
eukprot:233185_1